MQAAQGHAAVLESHATDSRRIGEVDDVHGRKGEQRMHDVGSRSPDPEQTDGQEMVSQGEGELRGQDDPCRVTQGGWHMQMGVAGMGQGFHVRRDMAGPQREVVGVNRGKLVVEAGDVVDEAKVLVHVQVRHGGRVDAESRERKYSRRLPAHNGIMDLGPPNEVGLVRRRRAMGLVVGAASLVLGAVAAVEGLGQPRVAQQQTPVDRQQPRTRLTIVGSFRRIECDVVCWAALLVATAHMETQPRAS